MFAPAQVAASSLPCFLPATREKSSTRGIIGWFGDTLQSNFSEGFLWGAGTLGPMINDLAKFDPAIANILNPIAQMLRSVGEITALRRDSGAAQANASQSAMAQLIEAQGGRGGVGGMGGMFPGIHPGGH